MNNQNNTSPWLHALLPTLAIVLYLLMGFTLDRGWAVGWIIFLAIPIIETLVKAIKTRNPSVFAYPVLVTAIFLLLGMTRGMWHPAWVLFITIPAYYAICDGIKKSMPQPQQNTNYQYANTDNQNSEQQGTYYNPPVQGQKSSGSNITSIIITIILSVTIIAVVGIICAFSWLGGIGGFDFIRSEINDSDEQLSYGSAEIPANDVKRLDIDWVSGDIDVNYYEGDTISVSETDTSEKYQLRYKVEDSTLYIQEFSNKINFSNQKSKDLTVQIPNNLKLDEIMIDSVSAKATLENINTDELELNTVSGNSRISFAAQPKDIEIDAVSGDVQIVFPKDITGYSISCDSVSADIDCNDFDNQLSYGDGATRIDLDSVSGDLTIEKAE